MFAGGQNAFLKPDYGPVFMNRKLKRYGIIL